MRISRGGRDLGCASCRGDDSWSEVGGEAVRAHSFVCLLEDEAPRRAGVAYSKGQPRTLPPSKLARRAQPVLARHARTSLWEAQAIWAPPSQVPCRR